MKWRLFGRVWHYTSHTEDGYPALCEQIFHPLSAPFRFAGHTPVPLDIPGIEVCVSCRKQFDLLSKTESK